MKNRWVYLLFAVFIISRLAFLGKYPFFYDSPEYLREAAGASFFSSLANMHEVIHPVYLFLTQMAYRIFGSSVSSVSIVSALFGIVGFTGFYLFVKLLFDKNIAFFASIPLIFFPHSFLLQTQIFHDSIEQSLFIVGLLFFTLFIKRRSFGWFGLALITVCLSLFNHLGMVFWLPVFIGLVIFISKQDETPVNFLYTLIFSISGLALAIIGYYFLYLKLGNSAISSSTFYLSGAGTLDSLKSFLTPLGFLRTARNAIYVLTLGYAPLAIILCLYFYYQGFKQKRYKLIIFVTSWFVCYLFSLSIWHASLFGRLGALITYPMALIFGVTRNKYVYGTLLATTVIVFIITLIAYRQIPIPARQYNLLTTANISSSDMLVVSDYQRPQLEQYYSNLQTISGGTYQTVQIKITAALKENKRIYITQQALTYPYWQYDGQTIHILSKGNSDKAHLTEYLKDKKLKIEAYDSDYPLLTVYRLY